MTDLPSKRKTQSGTQDDTPAKKPKLDVQIRASKKKLQDTSDDEHEEEEEEESKSRESHAKQKKLREERKMAKPHAETIQSIKLVWERLRVKKGLTPAARHKLVAEAWALAKPLVTELALKHDTSRIVQTLVKYADKPLRNEITVALQPVYFDLATSSYGKYLVIKLLHYGSADTRDAICSALLANGAARKLIRHIHGAYVLEDMYRYYASAKFRNLIVLEFFDATAKPWATKTASVDELFSAHPEKRADAMAHAFKRLQAAVEKGSIGFNVIHAVMLQYVKHVASPAEREAFIDLITDGFAEIVHTPEGSETAARVCAIATAKERKRLLRALKDFAHQLAADDYGCFVLIALFETVDDTVLVRKVFADGLKDHMGGLLTSKAGRRPFLYLLLGPSPRYFSKDQIKLFDTVNKLKQETSKKEDAARRHENLESFSPLMLDTVREYPRKMFEENVASQTAVEILLYTAASDKQPALQAVASTFAGAADLLAQPYVPRALRTLVLAGHWNSAAARVEPVPADRNPGQLAEFRTLLASVVAADAETARQWATGPGAFVVVALLETVDGKSKHRKALVKVLRECRAEIEAAESKGSQLLLNMI